MRVWQVGLLWVVATACDPGAADVRRPDNDDGSDPIEQPIEQPSSDPFTEAPPHDVLNTPQITTLADRIDALLDRTSASHSVAMIDLDSGQIVYESDPDRWLKPASNTKLFTTGAALDNLGVEHRAEVRATSDSPVNNGSIDTLTVVGGHDVSWSTWLQMQQSFPAHALAEDLHLRGLRTVQGNLVVRGAFAVEAHRFGTYNAATHRQQAANLLANALKDQGIAVQGRVETESSLVGGAHELAVWRGPTLAATTAPINRISHNEFADLLAHHIGYELEGDNSYAGSQAAIRDWLSDYDLDVSGLALHDGSGLSHNNRVSANLVVGMFGALAKSPVWTDYERSLSIAGADGTLAGRMADPDTQYRVLGKSGTLNGVITTSGVLHHRHDGHRYAFSVLMNDAWSASTARALQDQIVAELARDLRRAGQRPPPPQAQSFVQHGDGSATLSWASDAEHIVLHLSEDGVSYTDVRQVSGRSYTVGDLHPGDRVYAKISAVNEAGWSETSDVLCVGVAAGASRGLLVDGNDRWLDQWENPLGQGHDMLARVAQALPLESWDSVHHDVIADGEVGLEGYDVVLWHAGEQSTEHVTFTANEQSLIWDYADDGGALLVSGAEIAWDLGLKGDDNDRAFLSEVLHAEYVADEAFAWHAGPAEAAFAHTPRLSFHHPGHMVVGYPDVLRPVGDARMALTYIEGNKGAAAVRYSGDYELIYAGFPIEMIDGVDDREALLTDALTAMGVLPR